MKKILITGGAGFIGCSLSRRLLAEDPSRQIVAMDNLHPQVHANQARPSRLPAEVELVVADVCDPSAWNSVLGRFSPDAVVHLAAETGTGQSLTESTRHAMVNVVGQTTMLDALSGGKHRPDRILLTSSRAIYGEGAWVDANGNVSYPGQRTHAMLDGGQWDFAGLKSQPFAAARTTPQPTSVYGATKLAQEHILTAWCNSFSVLPLTLRLQNVYGPGQSLSNPYTGIVPLFARLAKAGKSIPLYEDGAMLRDFVYIEDVTAAIAAALTRTGATSQPLDVGTGRATSIREIAEIVASLYGAPAPHVCGLYRDGDVRHASCDISGTMAALDWSPRMNVQDGIAELCHWIDKEAS